MEAINLHNYEAFLLDYSEGNLSPEDVAALEAFVVLHPELEINLDELALPELLEESFSVDFKSTLKKNDTDVPDELLLNYIEGILSPEQKAAFEEKLQSDAELAKDLELYRKTILASEPVLFESKSALLKTEDDLILNNSVIAYVEHQLSPSEKAGFEKELKTNNGLKKELALVLKTKAVADVSVVYPDKEALKKENRVIALFSLRTVAAVAAAILLLIGFVVVVNRINSKPVDTQEVAVKTATVNGVKKAAQSAEILQAAKGRPLNDEMQAKATLNDGMKKNTNGNSSNDVANKATNNIVRKSATKKDTVLFIQKPVAPVNIAQQDKKVNAPALKNAPVLNEKQESIKTGIASSEKNSNLPDTSSISDETNFSHQVLIASVEEEEPVRNSGAKKGFWDRAVEVAKRANKLGVKSVDGVEKPNKSYFLSFNSFSVEKK